MVRQQRVELSEARVWGRKGDERVEANRAIEACARDHGGKLIGRPWVMGPHRLDPKDGRVPVEATLLLIEEDPDGWWEDYCKVHKWLLVRPGWLDQLYS